MDYDEMRMFAERALDHLSCATQIDFPEGDVRETAIANIVAQIRLLCDQFKTSDTTLLRRHIDNLRAACRNAMTDMESAAKIGGYGEKNILGCGHRTLNAALEMSEGLCIDNAAMLREIVNRLRDSLFNLSRACGNITGLAKRGLAEMSSIEIRMATDDFSAAIKAIKDAKSVLKETETT